jgi:hypothetical protein
MRGSASSTRACPSAVPGSACGEAVSAAVDPAGVTFRAWIRLRCGSTRCVANASVSRGWWVRIGCRVVGRMAPERVTGWPTIALTSVDLPAPVDPPTTASSGASSERTLGRT